MPMPTRCKPTTSAGGEDVRRQKSGKEGTLDRSDDDQRLPQPAPSEEELEMTKITTGPNDAPKDATIAQSAPGLPEDTSLPVEATEEEALWIKAKVKGTNDEGRKDDARDLAAQLARPKHGTA